MLWETIGFKIVLIPCLSLVLIASFFYIDSLGSSLVKKNIFVSHFLGRYFLSWFKFKNYKNLKQHCLPFLVFILTMIPFIGIPLFGPVKEINFYPELLSGMEGTFFALFSLPLLYFFELLIVGKQSVTLVFLYGPRRGQQILCGQLLMLLASMPMVLIYKNIGLHEVVSIQRDLLWGVIPSWGIFLQPVSCILFFIACLMLGNKFPFNDQEILKANVFNSKQTSLSLFFVLKTYLQWIILTVLFIYLFLGGYTIPFKFDFGIYVPLAQFTTLGIKCLLVFFGYFILQVSLPLIRLENFISSSWNKLIPLGIINLLATTIILYWP